MINVENDVFTELAVALREQFPGIYVAGEYISAPPSFPAVTFVEADNYVVREASTIAIEDAVQVMYTLSVYSNKVNGKKSEAKAISDYADEVLRSLGFTRTTRTQVPNIADATIYRLESRYEAVVGPGLEDGTYIIYQEF